MKNDLLAFFNTAKYFDLKLAPVADLNIAPSRYPLLYDKDAPALAVSEQPA
jgi:hypothetical protein